MALTQISTQGIKDGTITGSDLATNVDLVDNQKIRFGTGNDLEIYHSSSNSFIRDVGTGVLSLDTNGSAIRFRKGTTETLAIFNTDGAVELYYDNSLVFETVGGGVFVRGDLTFGVGVTGNLKGGDNDKIKLGSSDDLQIYHDGSNSFIKDSGTGFLKLITNTLVVENSGSSADLLRATESGSVDLFYNGSKKFETTSTGVKITGSNTTGTEALGDFRFENAAGTQMVIFEAEQSKMRHLDDIKATFGTGDDLQILHDGTHSLMENSTGILAIRSDSFQITDKSNNHAMITATADGSVELYHDNALKFETTSSGVQIAGKINFTGTGQAIDLIDNQQIRLGTGDDLQIYHDGSNSYVSDSGTGDLRLSGNVVKLNNSGNTETMLKATENGAVELYYDNSKKFETTSGGVLVTGDVESSTGIFEHTTNFTTQLKFNGSNETQLKHLSNGQVKLSFVGLSNAARGSIDAQSGFIQIKTAADETGIICRDNSSTDLHFDGTKKFETHSAGVLVSGNVYANDNNKFIAGTHNDLQIYHNGSHSFIDNNTGDLNIESSAVLIKANNTENAVSCLANGAVELYYDNSKKFETVTAGVSITGQVSSDTIHVADGTTGIQVGDSSDLKIYHDGSNNNSYIIESGSGNLVIGGDMVNLTNAATTESYIRCTGNAQVELYHNNSKKFETQANGITVTGGVYSGGLILGDNDEIEIGNAGDLKIYHNGSNSYIDNEVGSFYIRDTGGAEKVRINGYGTAITGGLLFGTDTAAANALDDYEEGSLNWELAKDGTPSLGSNNGSNVKYVKVGRLVHISGRVRTDSTGSEGADNFVFQSGSTLPFTPETSGTSVVGHWRSQDQTDRSLTASIAWVGSSTTMYLYTIDSKADYAADSNNVPADNQTNLVITFSLTYRANS